MRNSLLRESGSTLDSAQLICWTRYRYLRAAHRSPRCRGSPVIPSPRSKHLANYCQRPACGVSLLIRVTYARTVMRSRVSKQVSPKCGWCVRAYVLRVGGWGGYWLVKNQPLLGLYARWGSMFAKYLIIRRSLDGFAG